MLQTEYNQALSGSMHEAQQASTMSASLAKTNWINSGLRSQVHSDNTRLVLLQYVCGLLFAMQGMLRLFGLVHICLYVLQYLASRGCLSKTVECGHSSLGPDIEAALSFGGQLITQV